MYCCQHSVSRNSIITYCKKVQQNKQSMSVKKSSIMKTNNTTQSQNDEKLPVVGSARYIVVNESVSSHCCFGYTIIDTAAGKDDHGDYWKRTMCETFYEEEAKIICNALNKHCY